MTAPRRDAAKVRLYDVLKPTTIDYLYDFGDSWELRLIVSGLRQGDPAIEYPRYIGGEWNAPPEDYGGIPGFYATLDAIADPANSDPADAIEWFEDYNPKAIDERTLATRRLCDFSPVSARVLSDSAESESSLGS